MKPTHDVLHRFLRATGYLTNGQCSDVAELLLAVYDMAQKPGLEPFVAKHYVGEEQPLLKGNGVDGLELDHQQDHEEFATRLNTLLGLC